MLLFQLILLALIQGLTEFLPISSSGHLILLSELSEFKDQGLAIDIAVHVGTLCAVVLFFWADFKLICSGTGRLVCGKVDTRGAFLALCLGIATVPIVIFGIILQATGWIYHVRSIAVIGWTMLIFGIFLYWADQTGNEERTAKQWRLIDATIMGFWQAVALIPGTSRSGITISAARRLGYTRRDSAALAMLMSIPAILASGVALSFELIKQNRGDVAVEVLLVAIFAFFAALLSLGVMMRLLERFSYTPYVIYRVILGVALLVYTYS
ncbi:MAG: undecaprenyl-diphosphate phosphatase [Aestuariivita sp.]|nr:undecaprenyl-diphosphate phosphatase [Aestuariivita sp.]